MKTLILELEYRDQYISVEKYRKNWRTGETREAFAAYVTGCGDGLQLAQDGLLTTVHAIKAGQKAIDTLIFKGCCNVQSQCDTIWTRGQDGHVIGENICGPAQRSKLVDHITSAK